VRKILPEYDYVYLGDNARAPYGTRSFEVVYEYTWQCVKYLFEQGCDLVILACNTASAKALRSIQQKELLDYPGKRVLGVIRPSAENISRFSKNQEIAVLATEGTVQSKSYILEFNKFSPETLVNQYACPIWVPLVESGEYKTAEGQSIIKRDLECIQSAFPNADVFLLGCTHYPILLQYILTCVPKSVKVISQGNLVAKSLKKYLSRHTWLVRKLSTRGTIHYLTTENNAIFDARVKDIFDIELTSEQIKIV
jgi:glutamate racemase